MSVSYSIVVPAYNSEASLGELFRRIHQVFSTLTPSYEIICVDDGSRDRTWATLQRLQAKDSKLGIVRLTKNFGQHSALMCGFRFAKGNYVITLDDDLQNPPEEIPRMIEAIQAEGYDVVIGIPKHKQHEIYRNLASRLLSRIIVRLFAGRSSLRISSFRIISGKVIKQLQEMRTSNPAIDTMIFSFVPLSRIKNITVEHAPRRYGKTQYTFSKLVFLAYNYILNQSAMPLKLVNVTGFLSASASFFLLLMVVIKYFVSGVPVMGWTSMMAALLFFSGLILFSLGLIGEYLIRILREVNYSVDYVIDEMTGPKA